VTTLIINRDCSLFEDGESGMGEQQKERYGGAGKWSERNGNESAHLHTAMFPEQFLNAPFMAAAAPRIIQGSMSL